MDFDAATQAALLGIFERGEDGDDSHLALASLIAFTLR
jgi:hypothetical protein